MSIFPIPVILSEFFFRVDSWIKICFLENEMARILVVDDEEKVRGAVARRLEREGHTVRMAETAAAGAAILHEPGPSFDVVVTDMSIEDENSGVEMLKAATERDFLTEVIVLTAYGNVQNAVECMQLGAFDYVEKNIPGADVYELLMLKIDHALQHRRVCFRAIERLTKVNPDSQ